MCVGSDPIKCNQSIWAHVTSHLLETFIDKNLTPSVLKMIKYLILKVYKI